MGPVSRPCPWADGARLLTVPPPAAWSDGAGRWWSITVVALRCKACRQERSRRFARETGRISPRGSAAGGSVRRPAASAQGAAQPAARSGDRPHQPKGQRSRRLARETGRIRTHHSTTPSRHHSITPSLHHSITPSCEPTPVCEIPLRRWRPRCTRCPRGASWGASAGRRGGRRSRRKSAGPGLPCAWRRTGRRGAPAGWR